MINLSPLMKYSHTVKVLEQCQISPPSGSVLKTSLPLSFFDLWCLAVQPPVHCLSFYRLESSKTNFMHSMIPHMKHSLSLTLQYFIPLTGNLIWSPESTVPEIVYVDGDSVSFTIVESDFSFDYLCENHPRDAKEFSPLNTPLLPRSSATGEIEYPLLALRVTLFPNSGICVGLSISHAVTDGMTANNFLRLWASICSNLGGDTTNMLSHLLPSFDKTTIINPDGIETIYLNYLKKINISQKSFVLPLTPTDFGNDKVVATFIMDLPKIQKLKKWVLSRIIEKTKNEPSFNLSAVVVTCAYVWACLVKALGGDSLSEHLAIPIDCRTRLDPALPEAYFGNCLMVSFTTMNNNDLVGKDGIAVAAEVIGKAIQTIAKSVFDGSENLLANLISLRSERLLAIAGSPRLKVYDINFGWGKPNKVEIISATAGLGYVSLCERGNHEDGGLEIGIALKKVEMDVFTSLFEYTLSSM